MTNRYLVVYAKSSQNYSGFAPDVPGCVSVGTSLEEMRSMLTEALSFHLEGTAEDGNPIPSPRTTQLDFTEQDFEGVEYFVVEHLSIPVPAVISPVQRIPRQQATAA